MHRYFSLNIISSRFVWICKFIWPTTFFSQFSQRKTSQTINHLTFWDLSSGVFYDHWRSLVHLQIVVNVESRRYPIHRTFLNHLKLYNNALNNFDIKTSHKLRKRILVFWLTANYCVTLYLPHSQPQGNKYHFR